MTHLRKTMLEELERRNYSESTTLVYLYTVEDFARFFHRPPDQLGPAQIREFTAHLFRTRKLADNTVAQRVVALRFFYTRTLKRSWPIEETPYPKKRTQLPVILSQDEVARLIESADSPFHRTILMTLYATGVRRAELANLKSTDIDSQRVVVHSRSSGNSSGGTQLFRPTWSTWRSFQLKVLTASRGSRVHLNVDFSFSSRVDDAMV